MALLWIPLLGEIMCVFRLWMLVLCKVSHVKAYFVHYNKAQQKLLSLIVDWTGMSDAREWAPHDRLWVLFRNIPSQICVFFGLLSKMLCAVPREMSDFRAVSSSLTCWSTLRKEFTRHTVSTVKDVLEPPSRCLSSTSVLSVSKAKCHRHNRTATLRKLRTSSPIGYLNSHLCDNIHTQKSNHTEYFRIWSCS
jgi:hypothetical protein